MVLNFEIFDFHHVLSYMCRIAKHPHSHGFKQTLHLVSFWSGYIIFLSWLIWFAHPYPSGLLHWHWGNRMSADEVIQKYRQFPNHNKPPSVCIIFGIYCNIRSVVSEAVIKGRDKKLHPTDTVGCNYLSLPLILLLASHFWYVVTGVAWAIINSWLMWLLCN